MTVYLMVLIPTRIFRCSGTTSRRTERKEIAGCSSGRNAVQFSDGWSYGLVDEIGEAGQRKSAKNYCFGPCSQVPGVGGFGKSRLRQRSCNCEQVIGSIILGLRFAWIWKTTRFWYASTSCEGNSKRSFTKTGRWDWTMASRICGI